MIFPENIKIFPFIQKKLFFWSKNCNYLSFGSPCCAKKKNFFEMSKFHKAKGWSFFCVSMFNYMSWYLSVKTWNDLLGVADDYFQFSILVKKNILLSAIPQGHALWNVPCCAKEKNFFEMSKFHKAKGWSFFGGSMFDNRWWFMFVKTFIELASVAGKNIHQKLREEMGILQKFLWQF